MANNQKANYGIDAPGVIRNIFLVSIAAVLVAVFVPPVKIGSVTVDPGGFIWSGFWLSFGGFMMLLYSLYGKYKHRDRMLNFIHWRGDEQVLDIGTGKGLLMIGAAKKLTTGKSTGIDIWNTEDLTGNNVENALKNAEIEGVKGKVEVKNENAMNMSFANGLFDVVVSNLCIHNIYNKEGRNNACKEIARVLKNGGTALISDFRHMKEYKHNFDQLGLQTIMYPPNYLTTFPPLKILVIKKA